MKRKPAMTPNHRVRRVSVIERLNEQLKLGVKNSKVENKDVTVPLTDKDVVRIKRELEILKARV